MAFASTQFLFSENVNIFFRDNATPLLDILFRVITDIGSEPVYIFLASLIYWCHDKKTGIRAMYVILFSAYVVILSKTLFGMPRPPPYLHKITENDFGFPSGHALLSSGVWCYLGLRSKRTQIFIIGAIIVFLVSLSRIYLGVHYPGDVIGGIIFGITVAFISYMGEKDTLRLLNKQSRKSKYIIALFLPIILVLLASLHGYLKKEQIELGVVMAGVGIGYLLEEEKIGFSGVKNKKQFVMRAFVGFLILGSIYLISELLSLIFPIFIYIKYAAFGFSWVFIVPWIFTKIETGYMK